MDRRPLIILGSARKESNTRKLTGKIFPGGSIEMIDLLDYKIDSYNYEGNYSPDDKFYNLMNIILNYNKIVFATPVYWYTMSGIMKTFFDRLTDIVTVQKEIGRKLKGKEAFLIAVGTDELLPEGFENPFRLTAEYLEMNFISTFYCKTGDLNSLKTEGLEFLNKMSGREI